MEKYPKPGISAGTKLAIIPMGIPGIGKSFVFEALTNDEEACKIFEFDSVSSDDIRKKCMDKYMAIHPGADTDTAFKGTQGPYKGAFSGALKTVASKTVPDKIHCIIVDKNHPGNGISASVEGIFSCLKYPKKFKAIGLISKEESYIKHKGKSYPFSYSTVLFCIKRLLERKEHSTLTCEDEIKAVHVLVFFLKLYQNFAPKLPYLQGHGLSGVIEVPFTPTIPLIPEDLIAAFNQVLDNTAPRGGDCQCPDLVQDLINKVRANSALFEKEADAVANAKIIFEELCKYADTAAGNPSEEYKAPVQPAEKKLPLYIGIQLNTPRDEILKVVLKGCKEAEKSATLDPKGDLKDLEKFLEESKGAEWKYPNSHHITALFIGGNWQLAETKIYKEFKEGQKQLVKLGAVVIIPHKLVFGICFPKIEISNKIPHVTLLLNRCPAKMSNMFGEALFLGVPEIKAKYEQGFFEKDGEEYLNLHDVIVEGKKYKAYLYKPKETMTLYGVTSKFY